MKSILNFFPKDIESFISGLLLGSITLVIFFEVFTRFLFSYSPSGTGEIETLFFGWFVLLGSVTATKKYTHVKIEVFVSRLKPERQQFFILVVDVLVLFFLVFLAIYGISYTKLEMLSVSSILEIPEGYFVLPIPLCAILMIIYRLISFKKNFMNYVHRKKETL
jgi:TRAP-type C4-dicarboxylate transport system permease small subunit